VGEVPYPVDRGRLTRAVMWLFGAPLLVLLSAVWLLQSLQLSQQPLFTFAVLAGIGWIGLTLAKRWGNYLLNYITAATT
jgi:hypothetical protein